MTWAEFKTAVEQAGVQGDNVIRRIFIVRRDGGGEWGPDNIDVGWLDGNVHITTVEMADEDDE